MTDKKLLIVEDDPIRSQMKWALCGEYNIFQAENRVEAIEIFKNVKPEVVILDLGLPPEPKDVSEGFKAIHELLEINPILKILVATGNPEKKNALKAIELGAFDFFTKPVSIDEMKVTVKRAFHVYELEEENLCLRKRHEVEALEDMVGTSGPMQDVFAMIRKVAAVSFPVLILGESGTGKELAASAIHRLSDRKKGSFVIINCGAIPENLLESELFGHERGSFTGADAKKIGKIEQAAGGTLFLDEVGELSLPLQVKLLRFLQEHTIDRVGGREPVKVDVRVIAATNRDIKAMVEKGSFREDLYYRLGVVTLELPPLRERREDIDILALSFLERYSKEFNRRINGFSISAISAMRSYNWPGNVRELENKVKRAVALGQKKQVCPEDLDLYPADNEAEEAGKPMNLIEARKSFEKRIIQEALLKNKGVISRAAADLGISRQYLSELVGKYEIKF